MAAILKISPRLSFSGDAFSGQFSETWEYVLKLDSIPNTMADVAKNAELPGYGTQLASTGLYVRSKEPMTTDNPLIYRVRVTWENRKPTDQLPMPEDAEATDKWNINIRCDSIRDVVEIQKDSSGKVIVNTNNEPINPPLTKTVYTNRYTVSYTTGQIDFDTLDACRGHSNDDEIGIYVSGDDTDGVKIFPIGTLLFDDYSFDLTTDISGVGVVNMQLIFFEHPKDPFTGSTAVWTDTIVANKSRYQKVSGNLVPIMVNNQKVTEDRYISSSGVPLVSGDSVYDLTFHIITNTSFDTLLSEIEE